jgi:peptidoglycan/LPS O-acetylase OafA/YrhL
MQAPAVAYNGPGGTRSEERFGYHPALDGVRGLAVAAVLIFHGYPAWLPGGFLGVDAFFVLSGFLITTLLLKEHHTYGRIRLGGFWARRARRLLPAFLLVLTAVVLLNRLLVISDALPGLRTDALAALGYVANWRMIYRGGDYFAADAMASPLQHTWSLAIEEQFYLLWPLAVVLILRLTRPRRTLVLLCGTGVVASMVATVLLYRPEQLGRVYYGTDTRASALLIGCGLAGLLAARPRAKRRPHPWLSAAGLAGMAVVAAAWIGATGDSRWLYAGGLPALAVAVAVVLAAVVLVPGGLPARLLATRPLVALGAMSYGVYLWHWPLFLLLTPERVGLIGPPLFAVKVGVTLSVAAASYHLVERPVRRMRPRWRTLAPTLGAGVAVTAAAALVATAAPVVRTPTTPTPVSMDEPAFPLPSVPAGSPSAAVSPSGTGHVSSPLDRPGRRPGPAVRVSIFGDSVAFNVGAYLATPAGVRISNRAIKGCGIVPLTRVRFSGRTGTRRCADWARRWQAGVTADDPDLAVVLLGRWEVHDREMDGRWRHIGDPEFDALLAKQLEQALDVITARGARALLLTAPYTAFSRKTDGSFWPEDSAERVDAWNAMLRAAAARRPGTVSVADLNRLVCPAGRYTWEVDGITVRSDGAHFTAAGIDRIVGPWLRREMARQVR